ncbi:MAG: hypothetical protein GX230_01085 [Lentisphaerae bacterium]|nr:hypothetical protein [Lentisphaerota bacterium]
MSQLFGEPEKKLPFPTRPLKVVGGVVEEYIIPDDKKAEVLELLYISTPVPDLDEEWMDIHEGKKFRIGDFRVVRENGHNWLVSPYYPLSGGSVIDWMPLDDDEDDDDDDDYDFDFDAELDDCEE